MLYNETEGIINAETLKTFVAKHAFTAIGSDDNGNPTTLSDEISNVAKMVSRADVCRIYIDPYRRARLAYAIAEMTQDAKDRQVFNNYRRAGQKVFWLNTMCRMLTGETFICKKLNPKDIGDIETLVDEFQLIIRLAAAATYKPDTE